MSQRKSAKPEMPSSLEQVGKGVSGKQGVIESFTERTPAEVQIKGSKGHSGGAFS